MIIYSQLSRVQVQKETIMKSIDPLSNTWIKLQALDVQVFTSPTLTTVVVSDKCYPLFVYLNSDNNPSILQIHKNFVLTNTENLLVLSIPTRLRDGELLVSYEKLGSTTVRFLDLRYRISEIGD